MAKREKTKYPGVYVCEAAQDKTFYISYRIRRDDGGFKQVEEVAGRQRRDAMTAARASHIRAKRMHGDQLPNRDRRAKAKAEKQKRTWTISRLWEEYIRARPDLKDNGSMNGNYHKYIEPHFADKEPKDILALDIDRLKRRQLKDKSPQTVAHVLELLRRLCNFGLKRGLCPGLSFVIQMPRLDNATTEDLNPGQLKRLLVVLDNHTGNKTPSYMAAYAMKLVLLTGMRRGEIFRLKWDDINWHRRNITLRQTKGGRMQTIPMSSFTESLLREIEEIPRGRSDYIFPGQAGGQRSCMKSAQTIKAEAGLPDNFRQMHGLRHLFGTNLGNAGVDRDIIARLMTHARDRSVTSRYVHYREETLREAAELAGKIVEGAAGDTVLHLEGKGS
ncbi:MAG: tyrosine-type recombinase/integrase [Thermoleophilia bacterium]|nr:tyrosine-type recombinase/integrase [Thermoleophilia bacterium]